MRLDSTKKVDTYSTVTPKSDKNVFTEMKKQVGENVIKIISSLQSLTLRTEYHLLTKRGKQFKLITMCRMSHISL